MTKCNLRKKIKRYVHEFYGSNPKELINNPQEMITLGNIARISRKSIKYIVHSRMADSYSATKITNMFVRAKDVLENPELDIPNHNKKYPTSRISGYLYPKQREALLIIYMPSSGTKNIFNAFYRSERKYRRMF
jgi:hypothetical protein